MGAIHLSRTGLAMKLWEGRGQPSNLEAIGRRLDPPCLPSLPFHLRAAPKGVDGPFYVAEAVEFRIAVFSADVTSLPSCVGMDLYLERILGKPLHHSKATGI